MEKTKTIRLLVAVSVLVSGRSSLRANSEQSLFRWTAACPVKAIFRIDAEETAIVEPNICHGCGACLMNCPAKAVVLKNS